MFVGLTECFDESMFLLKELFSPDLNINYARVNVARDNTIAENLLTNEKSRQILIEANQADLELYSFVTEKLFPSFQEQYGSSLKEDVANYQETRVADFNNRNITRSRMKQYVLYKPLLYLFRKGIKLV